ncbi:DUF3592 domain-containing protein [Nocardiopsis sp. CNT-189]|uniref:DUF3592 domain-containing protein n=1 Tax=Nocardiopsis oceanisediminis TaxID=2816862 RepID=UPI003B33369A
MDLTNTPYAWIGYLLVLLVGVVLAAGQVREILRTRNLRRTGARADGEVVRHSIGESSNGNTTYAPVVAWRTPDGRKREYCPSWRNSGKGRFRVGRRVVIYYDPADPDDRAALRGYNGGPVTWFVLLFAAVIIGIALLELATVVLGR